MNIGAMLANRAKASRNKTAVIFKENRITYGELDTKSNLLGHALMNWGVQKGDRVAVLMHNCSEFLEIYFALAKIGAIVVPLNARLITPELVYMMNDSGSKLMFVGESFVETAKDIQKDCPDLAAIIQVSGEQDPKTTSYKSLFVDQNETMPRVEIDLDDPQVILYSSGTTGRPKGAVITHGNTFWNSFSSIIDFKVYEEDITLTCLPLYHTGGLNILTIPHLHVGGTVIIHEHFDPQKVWETIERDKVTTLMAVPAMYNFMLQVPDVEKYDKKSIKFFNAGGAPVPLPQIERYLELGITFQQGYGLTEATVCVSLLRAADSVRKAGSAGVPFLHNEIRVVDDDGNDVPIGTAGEIIVKGPNVMQGYWGLPNETAQSVVNRWLHTGDIGVIDEEGYMTIVDRAKDMIISGGINTYPAEIEEVLYQNSKILEAAVVGMPDEKWGETVRAFVVPKPDENLTQQEIIDFCETRMAKYKVPKQVDFIEALPRNATGKVLKRVLREAK